MPKPKYWELQDSTYAGLLERCAPGTHEAVGRMLVRHSLQPRPALDLAAGSGALLARMRDIGFRDLNAIEIDQKAFGLAGITPRAIDLNTDFATSFSRQFGLITAVEIIEHLDSPRHFLRQIWNLLEPDGYLLVTTPNISHWVGRLWFLIRGELRYFKKADYENCRHISAINDTHMRLILREIGFEVIDFQTAGSFYGPLKRAIAAPLSAAFRVACGPLSAGDTVIYLARKVEPDTTSPGRSSIEYIKNQYAKVSKPRDPAEAQSKPV